MVKHDPEGDDLPSELDEEEDEGGRAEEAIYWDKYAAAGAGRRRGVTVDAFRDGSGRGRGLSDLQPRRRRRSRPIP